MSQCLPGMPCFENTSLPSCPTCNSCITIFPSECTPECIPISSDCLYYSGPNLINSGIETNDDLTLALEKLDELISSGGVPAGRILTINGTSYDLSADRTWVVGDVLTSGSYSNPSWITSLAYSKITGVPAFITLTSLSAGTGISYNNLSGVITNSAPDQTVTLTAGTNISITGTYPNFTINASGGSGWPLTGTADLTGNASVTGATGTYGFDIGTGLDELSYLGVHTSGNIVIESSSGDISINPFGAGKSLTLQAGSNSFYISDSAIELFSDSGTMTIEDSRIGALAVGIQYIGDYSANYTNRSLVDKEFVINSIASIATNPFADNVALIKNNADNTKLAIFSAASISTGTTRTYSLPNFNGNVLVSGGANTLSGNTNIDGAQDINFGSVTPLTNFLLKSNYIYLNGDTEVAANKTFRVGPGTVDPSGLGAGSLFYRTDTDNLRIYTSSWKNIALNPVTTTGDIIQSTSGTTLSRLASVATGNVLISGGVATVNSWGKVGLTTHISGVLAGANGGTGVANTGFTITLAGNLVTTGAFNTTFAVTGSNTITFPNFTGNALVTGGTNTLTANTSVVGSGSNFNLTFGTAATEIGTFTILTSGSTEIGGSGANTSSASIGSITGYLRNGSYALEVTPSRATVTNGTRTFEINSSGVALTLGSDAEEDIYVRRGGLLTRIPVGTNTQVLTVTAGVVGWAASAGGSGLTVGTTSITSGTTTRILYDNAGTLGEYTITGTGTVVAMATSPVFTTPNIGVATGTASGNWFLASGGTLTGANTITGTTTNTLKFVFDSLGVTHTNGAGHWLANTTAATVGAQQKSPSTVWEGQVFETTGSASQSVKYNIDVLPVQGTSSTRSGQLRFGYSINGGAYTTQAFLSGDGGLNFPVSGSYILFSSGNGVIQTSGGGNMRIGATGAGGGVVLEAAATSINGVSVATIGGAGMTQTTGSAQMLTFRSSNTFAPTSGTATYSAVLFNHVLNTTGSYSGTAYGIDYNPSLTGVTGLTHIAIRTASGNWQMQGSATTFTLGGGATASELRFLEPSGSGSNYTAFKAVAQGADITYSLPPTVGAAGTVLTDVAGNGVLTWVAGGGATLTGSTDEIIKYSSSTSGIGSKVFSTSNGNLRLGDSGLSGGRTISTLGSASASLSLVMDSILDVIVSGSNYSFTTSQFGLPNGVNIFGGAAMTVYSGNELTLTTTQAAGGNTSAVKIKTGSVVSGNGSSASIFIDPGTKSGTGTVGNLCIFDLTGSFGAGEKVIFIANATTVPTSDPTGGGILYVEAGALKWRGSSGAVTTLGPA